MDKQEIVHILNEIGTLLEIKGENPFKTNAYFQGARVLEAYDGDLKALVEEGKITSLKGIGKALGEKITSLVMTGSLPYYDRLLEEVPKSVLEMKKIPGLGSKRIGLLYRELGIASVGELEYAAKENRLLELEGFGEKTQQRIIKKIEVLKKNRGKFLYWEIIDDCYFLLKQIEERLIKGERATVTGEIRRKNEIIQKLSYLVVCEEKRRRVLLEKLSQLKEIEKVLTKTERSLTVFLKVGIEAEMIFVLPEEYPVAETIHTGSRIYAEEWKNKMEQAGHRVMGYLAEGSSALGEKELYQAAHLQYVEPELREDKKILDLAEKNQIPKLIEEKDLLGIFHVHSVYSDGSNTLEEIIAMGRRFGYSYIGISDHSQSAFYANGLKPGRLKRQMEEIDRLNEKNSDIVLLKGVESDILRDGSLDYEDSLLEQLDFVVVSIHNLFRLSYEEQTARLLEALRNPYTTMLGHMTGRLLLSRDGYDFDQEKIFLAAKENNVVIELNANPQRLDADWRYFERFRELGIRISINPDAHSASCFYNTAYGVNMARKGMMTKQDVVNTYPEAQLKEVMKRWK